MRCSTLKGRVLGSIRDNSGSNAVHPGRVLSQHRPLGVDGYVESATGKTRMECHAGR